MITFQPDLREVGEAAGAGDISRGKMGVVIDDGLLFRIVVVEPFSRRGMQQEVVVDEVQHETPVLG